MNRPAIPNDRYLAVGLRGNPFVADPVSSAELTKRRFVSRHLPNPPPPGSGHLVQVLGEEGAGKTTHIMYWRSATPGPYHYVPRRPYRHRWRRPPVGPLVYADEIDRMPRIVRWLWFAASARAGSTIVAGTHLNLSKPARRAGLLATTHRLGPIDRRTLRAIIEAKLRSAAVDDGDLPAIFDDADLARIHQKSNGSVREAEILCHELLAERVLKG